MRPASAGMVSGPNSRPNLGMPASMRATSQSPAPFSAGARSTSRYGPIGVSMVASAPSASPQTTAPSAASSSTFLRKRARTRTSTTSSRVSGGHARTRPAGVLNTSRSEITRAFGVRRSAYAPPPDGIASTSLDTMLCRCATASGPDIRTSARSGTTVMSAAYYRAAGHREAADYPDAAHEPGSQGRRRRDRRVADLTRPVLHGQVAGAARGQRAEGRSRDLGLPGLRAGATPAPALVRRPARARRAPDRGRHPLRDALV